MGRARLSLVCLCMLCVARSPECHLSVDRPAGGLPTFHVQTSADLRAGHAQAAGRTDGGVMMATEELQKYPAQLNGKHSCTFLAQRSFETMQI